MESWPLRTSAVDRRTHQLAADKWLPLSGSLEQQASLLEARVNDISQAKRTLFHEFAAVDAVMRERGAYLVRASLTLNDGPFSAEEYQGVKKRREDSVAFLFYRTYLANNLYVGSFSPVFKFASISVVTRGYISREDADAILKFSASDVDFSNSKRTLKIRQPHILTSLLGFEGSRSYILGLPTVPCEEHSTLQHLLKRNN